MENRVQINASVFLSIEMIGLLVCDADWTGKEHTHPFWEIILTSHDLNTFHAMLIAPNEPHFFHNSTNKPAHILYLGFRFNPLSHSDTEKQYLSEKLNNPQNFKKYAALFAEMKKDGEKTAVLSQTFAFLTELLREPLFEGPADTPRNIVSEIKKYISANLNRPLTVKQIAGTFYLSPKYIGNVFRQKTGMGILQYQKAKKMERALLYLKGGEHTVKEIASLLGFETVSYFSNTFKDYYGLSPINFSKIQERKNL